MSSFLIRNQVFCDVLGDMTEHAEAVDSSGKELVPEADPKQVAAFVTAMNVALDEAVGEEGRAESAAREDGVDWHVEDEFMSLLQSFSRQRTEQAQAEGRLAGPITDLDQFREVLYDDRDIGRWIWSFFHWKLIGKHASSIRRRASRSRSPSRRASRCSETGAAARMAHRSSVPR